MLMMKEFNALTLRDNFADMAVGNVLCPAFTKVVLLGEIRNLLKK